MIDNGYQLLNNFLTQTELFECVESFKSLPLSKMNKDLFGPSIHNYPIFVELLCNKLHILSALINESLLPTYAYGRKYKNGAKLPIHTDRPSCEISVTVHLYGDDVWPFFLTDKSGNTLSFNLNAGDAVLYYGMEVPHWRDRYEGEEYGQVFLHYVRSRGKYREFYFDLQKFSRGL